MLSERFQTSAPGYSRSVSCDVGRPGGYLFSFVFSGFRRRRFESSSGLCFACMPWPRILLLFEAFGTVFQSQISRWCRRDSRRAYLAIVELFLAMSEGLEDIFFLSFSFFLVGSVGDVSRVLLACVLHALGTNPAAVRGFRNRFPRPNFEMLSERFQTSAPGYSRSVSCDVARPGGYLFSFLLVGSVGDVSRVFLACVLHALGTNPAAVRGFRNRFPKPNFEMLSERFQTSAPGYSRSVSCDVGRPGGYLFSFL